MRKWLRELRELKQLSQDELSKRLGITQTYYSKIENGKRRIDLSLPMTIKLSEILNVTVEQIVNYENKKSTEVGA